MTRFVRECVPILLALLLASAVGAALGLLGVQP